MKISLKHLAIVFLILLGTSTPVLANVSSVSVNPSAEDLKSMNEVVSQSTLLLQLKQKLAQSQYRYFLLVNNMEKAKDGLVELDDAIAKANDEIGQLDILINDVNMKIKSVKTQIEKKKMDLKKVEEDVKILELEIEDQKAVVGDFMALLYVKRGVYYDESGINPVKVLAGPDSISTTLQKMTYLDLMENENQSQIKKLIGMNDDLTSKWDEIRLKRSELDKMDGDLQIELNELLDRKRAKTELLNEMMGEKSIYESMLTTAGDKEDDMLREIEIYEKNVQMMEAKLAGSKILLSEDQQKIIENIEADAASSFSVDDAAEFLQLDWPLSPESGLTAYFEDSGYVAKFGVQHHALDIRAKHGSPIFAPADGVVYSVVFDSESTRYAYIMLAHRKGVMTLYGHVSEVSVQPGDYISRGQIIGLTGATPGSIGSGVRTTGPHLHFEVWQDGIKVDPLKYLPLEEVPSDSLPKSYLGILQGKLEEQIKILQAELTK